MVDNGSSNIPLDASARFPGVTFIRQEQRGSYSARNMGVRRSASEIIAFTDADCLPAPDWLQNGVTMLVEGKGDIVCGNVEMFLVNPDNPSSAELYNFAVSLAQWHCVTLRNYGATANLMTRRTAFEAVGPFSEAVMSGGDKQWSRRAHAKGYRLSYCATAIVRHPTRSNEQEVFSQMRRFMAGARDREPGLLGCLRSFVKHTLGIGLDLTLIWGSRGRGLNVRQRFRGSAFSVRYRAAAIRERLRLQFTKAQSPRS